MKKAIIIIFAVHILTVAVYADIIVLKNDGGKEEAETAKHPRIQASEVKSIEVQIYEEKQKEEFGVLTGEKGWFSGIIIFKNAEGRHCSVEAGKAEFIAQIPPTHGKKPDANKVINEIFIKASGFEVFGNTYGYPFRFKYEGSDSDLYFFRWEKFAWLFVERGECVELSPESVDAMKKIPSLK